MGRPEAIQWNSKQWLGDNKILAMDWDARAMHFHLLNLSTQEEPPGSIPNDMAAISRWLSSPSDDVWRRVRPQILAAWELRGDRWFSPGMERTFEKKANYASRPQNGTTSVPYRPQKPPINALEVLKGLDLSNSRSKEPPKSKPKFYLPDWIPKETWQAFEEMRKKIRKPMTDKARELLVRRLETFKSEGCDPQDLLEAAVLNSWQSVYKPNGNGKGTSDKHARDQEAISRIWEELHGADDGDTEGRLPELQAKRQS